MNTNFIKDDNTLIIKLTEEIDHCKAEELRIKVDYEIEKYIPKRVILDFEGVTFMDSSGIGFLLGRYKLANMLGGDLGIINISKPIKKILEMSGALKVVPIYNEIKMVI